MKGDEERFICVDNAVSSKGRKDKEILGTRWNSLCEGTSGICAKGERVEEDTLRECHDTLWAGHPGSMCTLILLERAFYWPYMGVEVQEYVKTYLICQHDKV